MGKIVKYHQPCLVCHSSDARQIYEDGTSFCFSCKRYFNNKGKEGEMPTPKMFQQVSLEEISRYKSIALKERKISKEVMEFFEVKVSFNEDGIIDTHYYPYENGYKVRKLPKTFSWVGSSGGVFGKKQFNGVNKKLIITEGEIDALSIAQASWDKYQRIYPVVALPSANATKELLKIRDWIREFQEVVLCLDEDEAGRVATAEAARIVGYDKAKVARLPCKDPNEVLVKKGGTELLNCVFNAIKYTPSGIISKEDIWEALEQYNKIESVPYPSCLSGLNEKVKGMRFGEIALFVSGTGCFDPFTKVRMYDKTTKYVKDICVGDIIMGDDDTPRTVLELFKGIENMYMIELSSGESFICNENHILIVGNYERQQLMEVKVKDYLDLAIESPEFFYKNYVQFVHDYKNSKQFTVRWSHKGKFNGFMLDGNHRFKLANGVIVRNSGKSSLIREIIYHILEHTQESVGIVALEESPAETARKLSSLVLNKNSAKEQIPLEELKVRFDKLFGTNRIVMLDHQGAMTDNSILDQLEYMALVGCKYIFIDHITILVSEGVEGLTGNESQDIMMNALLKLVKRHNVYIGLVSHLRKTPNQAKSFEEGKLPSLDSIRGSGSVKQISMDVIGFARDMTAEDIRIRNQIKMSVLKCRHTGLTGPVNGCYYDYETGRLKENSQEFLSIDDMT